MTNLECLVCSAEEKNNLLYVSKYNILVYINKKYRKFD